MSTTSEKTKKGVAVKDFTDAGTGQAFTKDAAVTLPEGQFDNYAAAGLVRVEDADGKASAKPAA